MANEIDDEERTNAVGLFNTARSCWRSAEHLNAASLKVTHPQAPVTFLFCHAIELYLKAYLRGTGSDLARLRKLGHRVAHLAKAATESGLDLGQEHFEILAHVDDADVAIEARYIVTGFKRVPTNEALSSVAEQLDHAVCAALTKRGFALRHTKFDRPDPQQQENELDADTRRVLVRLFEADELDDRSEAAMAAALGIKKPMLRYHLDVLQEANLAQISSFDDNHTYWTVRPEGRRYVVEYKPAD